MDGDGIALIPSSDIIHCSTVVGVLDIRIRRIIWCTASGAGGGSVQWWSPIATGVHFLRFVPIMECGMVPKKGLESFFRVPSSREKLLVNAL